MELSFPSSRLGFGIPDLHVEIQSCGEPTIQHLMGKNNTDFPTSSKLPAQPTTQPQVIGRINEDRDRTGRRAKSPADVVKDSHQNRGAPSSLPNTCAKHRLCAVMSDQEQSLTLKSHIYLIINRSILIFSSVPSVLICVDARLQ